MNSAGFVEPLVAESFMRALSDHDGITHAHSIRVAVLARTLGSHLGMSGDSLDELGQAAELHDLGKLVIPLAILQKVDPLSEVELSLVRRHSDVGADILLSVSKDQGRIAEAVRHHHEWFNGQGYPSSLSGAQIPKLSRIIAVVDVFDAITHQRPYRNGHLTSRDAMTHLEMRSGVQFDPEVVVAMSELTRELGLIGSSV